MKIIIKNIENNIKFINIYILVLTYLLIENEQ